MMLSVSEMERHNAGRWWVLWNTFAIALHCLWNTFAPGTIVRQLHPSLLWDEQLCTLLHRRRNWNGTIARLLQLHPPYCGMSNWNATYVCLVLYRMQNCVQRSPIQCEMHNCTLLKCNILLPCSIPFCRIALFAEEPQCKIVGGAIEMGPLSAEPLS